MFCTLGLNETKLVQESRAIVGRTAWCRCKFLYVSNFTTASCGFSAFLYIHQRPFKILKLHTVRWLQRVSIACYA